LHNTEAALRVVDEKVRRSPEPRDGVAIIEWAFLDDPIRLQEPQGISGLVFQERSSPHRRELDLVAIDLWLVAVFLDRARLQHVEPVWRHMRLDLFAEEEAHNRRCGHVLLAQVEPLLAIFDRDALDLARAHSPSPSYPTT
jgi:hypothetical protein